MTWFDYFLIAWLSLGAFISITQVGKQRSTLEPSTAAVSTLITAALIVGLLFSRGVFA